jgi:hypothetical protein
MKSLWAMVQGDPVFMRRVNGWFAVFFAVLILPAWILHWVESTVFVSLLSIWALVSGHWAAWQAARVEQKQDEQEKRHGQEGT